MTEAARKSGTRKGKTQASETRAGRPPLTDDERARMRAHIEKAALRPFQRHGFGAVSMRRIATEVRCSPMTLYSYFADKTDLLRALWRYSFLDLFAALDAPVAKARGARARLKALSLGYVRFWLDHTDQYRMVFMAEGVTQPEVSVFLDDEAVRARFSRFHELIAQARGELSPNDIKGRGDFLLACLHGVAHCAITMSGYPWEAPEALAERAIAAALAP